MTFVLNQPLTSAPGMGASASTEESSLLDTDIDFRSKFENLPDAGKDGEMPQDIGAFFGHPLNRDASALALLHEYQNLPAIDKNDIKIGDKYGPFMDILRADTSKRESLSGAQAAESPAPSQTSNGETYYPGHPSGHGERSPTSVTSSHDDTEADDAECHHGLQYDGLLMRSPNAAYLPVSDKSSHSSMLDELDSDMKDTDQSSSNLNPSADSVLAERFDVPVGGSLALISPAKSDSLIQSPGDDLVPPLSVDGGSLLSDSPRNQPPSACDTPLSHGTSSHNVDLSVLSPPQMKKTGMQNKSTKHSRTRKKSQPSSKAAKEKPNSVAATDSDVINKGYDEKLVVKSSPRTPECSMVHGNKTHTRPQSSPVVSTTCPISFSLPSPSVSMQIVPNKSRPAKHNAKHTRPCDLPLNLTYHKPSTNSQPVTGTVVTSSNMQDPSLRAATDFIAPVHHAYKNPLHVSNEVSSMPSPSSQALSLGLPTPAQTSSGPPAFGTKESFERLSVDNSYVEPTYTERIPSMPGHCSHDMILQPKSVAQSNSRGHISKASELLSPSQPHLSKNPRQCFRPDDHISNNTTNVRTTSDQGYWPAPSHYPHESRGKPSSEHHCSTESSTNRHGKTGTEQKLHDSGHVPSVQPLPPTTCLTVHSESLYDSRILNEERVLGADCMAYAVPSDVSSSVQTSRHDPQPISSEWTYYQARHPLPPHIRSSRPPLPAFTPTSPKASKAVPPWLNLPEGCRMPHSTHMVRPPNNPHHGKENKSAPTANTIQSQQSKHQTAPMNNPAFFAEQLQRSFPPEKPRSPISHDCMPFGQFEDVSQQFATKSFQTKDPKSSIKNVETSVAMHFQPSCTSTVSQSAITFPPSSLHAIPVDSVKPIFIQPQQALPRQPFLPPMHVSASATTSVGSNEQVKRHEPLSSTVGIPIRHDGTTALPPAPPPGTPVYPVVMLPPGHFHPSIPPGYPHVVNLTPGMHPFSAPPPLLPVHVVHHEMPLGQAPKSSKDEVSLNHPTVSTVQQPPNSQSTSNAVHQQVTQSIRQPSTPASENSLPNESQTLKRSGSTKNIIKALTEKIERNMKQRTETRKDSSSSEDAPVPNSMIAQGHERPTHFHGNLSSPMLISSENSLSSPVYLPGPVPQSVSLHEADDGSTSNQQCPPRPVETIKESSTVPSKVSPNGVPPPYCSPLPFHHHQHLHMGHARHTSYDLKSPDSGFGDNLISPTGVSQAVSIEGTAGDDADFGDAANKRRRSSIPQAPSNITSQPSIQSKSAVVIPKLEPDLSGYRYYLETNTSMHQKLDEDRITYLNKGQFYRLVFDYKPMHRVLRASAVKSIVMVVFREEKSVQDELKAWDFWYSRQPNMKMRILDVDTKNSEGVVANCIEEIAHNAVAIQWSPMQQPAKINIAVNCLSTDFSNQKGVKGLPLHVQVDTFEDATNATPIHRGYCQVKIFCDKGAERKIRDEEKRKMAKVDKMRRRDELYHQQNEISEFYSMAELTKPPIFFIPRADVGELTSKTSQLDASLYNGNAISVLDDGVSPAKQMRQKAPEDEKVMLYVKEPHENVFTALMLQNPGLTSFIAAVEEKYELGGATIRHVYKRSKKGILVKMDDNIIRHYSNESAFILSIQRTEWDGTRQSFCDITLSEIDIDAENN